MLYLDFRECVQLDPFEYAPHQIRVDQDTRIRVYCGQFMETVLENIKSKDDILFHASLFYKYGDRLAEKFPNHADELLEASMVFWQRTQQKLKQENEIER